MTKSEPNLPNSTRFVWSFIIVGLVFVVAAIAFGRATNLAERFAIDMQGESIEGDLEIQPDGRIRIRYSDSEGSIYRSTFSPLGYFLDASYKEGPISIKYLVEDPHQCQPAGASYRVGAITLVLFCFGFACVLRARRYATQPRPGI